MGRLWTVRDGKRVRTKAGVKHEYEKFQSSSKAKAERAARNSARRAALKSGRAKKNDGTEVHHSKGINSKSGLRVISRSENRSKREKSRKRGSRRNTAMWGK